MARARNQLTLGGIAFESYSTPDILPNGGRQEDEFRNGLQTIALDKAARDYLLDSALARIGHSR
jgi:hypothetical protein